MGAGSAPPAPCLLSRGMLLPASSDPVGAAIFPPVLLAIHLPVLLPVLLAIHLSVLLPVLLAIFSPVVLSIFSSILLPVLLPIGSPIFLAHIGLSEDRGGQERGNCQDGCQACHDADLANGWGHDASS